MKKLCIVAILCLGAIGCCPDIAPLSLEVSRQAVVDTRQVAQDYNDLWKVDINKLIGGGTLTQEQLDALKGYVQSHGNWLNLNRDRTKNIDRVFQALNE